MKDRAMQALYLLALAPVAETTADKNSYGFRPERSTADAIEQCFKALGKFDGTLLVKPSKKNTHAFLEKVRSIIDANKSSSQESLIRQLNPVIRGWVNYHRHIVAAKAFQQVDHVVWCRLWRWARRRHPEKSSRWVKKRYFHPIDRRTEMFAADTGKRTPEGKPIWLKLVYASDTKIRRHLKIRAEANPFDPDWQDYFAERAFRKKFGIHRYEAGIKPS
jgi:RNA-directed DNA polymerase